MNKQPKMNVLLAKTDHLASSFKNTIVDYVKFFKANQGAFIGDRKTYTPKEGTIDIPNERKNTMVVTTVTEKLNYLVENSKDYIDALFAMEATNASGRARAELVIDGESLGNYSALELLRLKSILENGSTEEMYKQIPVRNDNEIWRSSTHEFYEGRDIYETELQTGVRKSTLKEDYILPDPNIAHLADSSRYQPQVATRDTTIELGDYTFQRFSGEMSHTQRAKILQRRTRLLNAVITALKEANDVESISSQMTSDKLFSYLHEGKIQ
jgi:hypothetical protein